MFNILPVGDQFDKLMTSLSKAKITMDSWLIFGNSALGIVYFYILIYGTKVF